MPRQPRVTSGDVLLADPAAGGSKGQYYTAPADLWENAVGRVTDERRYDARWLRANDDDNGNNTAFERYRM